MMQVKTFYVNELRECCYVVYDETQECVIVDPGLQTESEQQRFVKFIDSNNLKPVKLICTHGHFDHIMGNAFITRTYNIKTYIHPEDKAQLERAQQYCQMFGFSIEQPPYDTIDLQDGDKVTFGNSEFEVLHTPGHTRGGVCFYSLPDKLLLSGDTLFAASIGRTDLPGGDYDALMESLKSKLCKLEPQTRVLPGHGPETTILNEMKTNPFLRGE